MVDKLGKSDLMKISVVPGFYDMWATCRNSSNVFLIKKISLFADSDRGYTACGKIRN